MTSRPLVARIAGLFYVGEMLAHLPGVLIRGRFIVPGAAAATATNILAHAPLFRLGFATDLLGFASYVAVTALFYRLFKPVNGTLSFLAALFSLVGCTVGAVSCLFSIAPLAVLADAPYLRVFSPEQVQALAFFLIRLYVECFDISFVFFGFYCLLIGYLVFRSGFLPRPLGVLMTVAGLGWLTFLSPPLVRVVSPFILATGILGEGSLTLWLLLKGASVETSATPRGLPTAAVA